MLHVWQVIRSRLASAGLPFTFWLAIVLYALSHLLPVTRLLDQWLLGWEASISTVEIAAETLWRGKHEWLFVFGWLPNLWFWLGVACWLIGRRRNRRLAGIGTGLAGLAGVACASLWLIDAGNDDTLSVGYYGWLASMALLSWSGFWAAAKTISPEKRT
jgi:hypothetical protein